MIGCEEVVVLARKALSERPSEPERYRDARYLMESESVVASFVIGKYSVLARNDSKTSASADDRPLTLEHLMLIPTCHPLHSAAWRRSK